MMQSEHGPELEHRRRLDDLRKMIREGAASASVLIVTSLTNVRYLTGFSGSAAVLMVTSDRVLLATDARYRLQASQQVLRAGLEDQVEIYVDGVGAQIAAVVAAASGAVRSSAEADATGRVALEADHVTWSGLLRWTDAFGDMTMVPSRSLVEGLRSVKDAGEQHRMRTAAAIADEALAGTVEMLRNRPTEAAVALALDAAMRRLGAEDRAFETIVASGSNSAKPHARPSARRIESGDPVVIDFGATYDGYRSDMTRTFCVGGDPIGELAKVFSVVGSAQAAGVRAVHPGALSGDVDQRCREIITAAGWADAFEHGTGHGVGLDIHEAPSVSAGGTAILTPGTVVTVEPGVYLAEVGGVRIEDTVLVIDGGCEYLTRFPKEVAA